MIKKIIRDTLNVLHLDLTKNLKYDRLTKIILKRELKPNSNCIDIGCHKGEILEMMLRYSENGSHFCFEPLPYLYKKLVNKNGLLMLSPLASSHNSNRFKGSLRAFSIMGTSKSFLIQSFIVFLSICVVTLTVYRYRY